MRIMTEKQKQQLARIHTDKTVHEKIRQTLKRKYASGELINPMTGVKMPPEVLAKLVKSHKGVSSWNKGIKGEAYLSHFKNTALWRENKTKAEARKTYEQRIRSSISSRLSQSKKKRSLAEMRVLEYLGKYDYVVISQFPFKYGVADIYVPEKHLIIQCYGRYWHSLPGYAERDLKQNTYLLENGFGIIILDSDAITRDRNPVSIYLDPIFQKRELK